MINNYIITTENESLQKIVISKNEQVEELQSMLEMKEKRIKLLETQTEDKKKILLEGKCTINSDEIHYDITLVGASYEHITPWI